MLTHHVPCGAAVVQCVHGSDLLCSNWCFGFLRFRPGMASSEHCSCSIDCFYDLHSFSTSSSCKHAVIVHRRSEVPSLEFLVCTVSWRYLVHSSLLNSYWKQLPEEMTMKRTRILIFKSKLPVVESLFLEPAVKFEFFFSSEVPLSGSK